jgi:choline dehydrogenase-like flavoprotein
MNKAAFVSKAVPLLKNYNTDIDHPVGVSIDNELFVNNATGLRSSADVMYLNNDFVLNNDNLTVITAATTLKIIREDKKRANGVTYSHKNKEMVAKLSENGKLILCAGAIYSPFLLLKSGFVFDATMINHYGTSLVFRVPICDVSSFSSGPLAFINEKSVTSKGQLMKHEMETRDWQIVVGGTSLLNATLVPAPEEGWTYVTLLLWGLNIRSRGKITISADDKPVVNFPMFSDGDINDSNSDISTCFQGMLYMKRVFDKLKYPSKELVFPPKSSFLLENKEQLVKDIKTSLTMTDHYSATCSNAIYPVNHEKALSTLETENVFVVDASSFTNISDGNTEYPTLVRAEYAAKVISKE